MGKLGVVDLGPGFEGRVGPYYPHMLSEDTIVWSDWLRVNPGRLDRVWYDVHVGVPVRVPNDLPPEILAVSRGVTRKRIDVVASAGKEFWVIEVKPCCNFTALGQIQVYRRLFLAEYDVGLPVVGVCVCANVDVDVADDFEMAGIRVEAIGFRS
jgi:hypothetical protein